MKILFRLKNGKTHEFTLPDDVEVHRALVLVSNSEKKEEKPKIILIPDDVEKAEICD